MQVEVKENTTNFQNYIRMAQTGHVPLFHQDWVSESLAEKHYIPIAKANRNVRTVFNQLSKHRTLDKKKVALTSMDKLSREEFIRSFFKIVEHNVLKDTKGLH